MIAKRTLQDYWKGFFEQTEWSREDLKEAYSRAADACT